MAKQKDNPTSIRYELMRATLEYLQGNMLRRTSKAAEADGDEVPEGVTEELDIAYINRQGVPLAMDIIGPANTEGAELPVVVTIHGGGLIVGDRRISRAYARQLALRGYLVFSIEYRLGPRANVCEQLDDVCAGMDLVGQRLVNYNVDFRRMFLTAESAGAYLAVYVAAMRDSTALQKAIGYEPTHMRFRALGLISGMFYTNRADPIGVLFADQFYGDKRADDDFLRYMDPEHPEILAKLPPCFFVTSRGDFLNSYTLDYHRAVHDAGRQTHLLYYGEEDLAHAFVTMRPNLEQSQEAIDKMCAWFEEMAKKSMRHGSDSPEAETRLAALAKRIDTGEVCHQKSWQLIRELNSVTEEKLDAIAIRDDDRAYTYRQLFRAEERYAEVFSALGITEANASRVGVVCTSSVMPIIAYYALNMVGASVSMMMGTDVLVKKWIRRVIGAEGITDLLVPDFCLDAELLRGLVKLKAELGLRHVIVVRASKGRAFETAFDEERARQNYRELKKVKGALFMRRLLREHDATPIAYGSSTNDEAAVIVHTYGTTKDTPKPIPLSDYGLNDAAMRIYDNIALHSLGGEGITSLTQPPFSACSMVDMVHMPLALGCSIAIPHGPMDLGLRGFAYADFLSRERVNVVFDHAKTFECLDGYPRHESLNLSELRMVVFCGAPISNEQLRRAKKTLKRFGAKPTLVNGYGTSECGAASIMHVWDQNSKTGRSEIGVPLKGVSVLIQDEETAEFHTLDEGPRMGVLYIASASNSCGRLGDAVLFEPVEVEDTAYLCTNDLVQVSESGTLTHVGRANRYFVDDADQHFEADVVESAIADESGIAACAILPGFDRLGAHDTVPILYVELSKKANKKKRRREVVRRALANAYAHDGSAHGNSLPWRCVICEHLPANAAGEVDAMRIMLEDTPGDAYGVSEVRVDGELEDVRLTPSKGGEAVLELLRSEVLPKRLRRERKTMLKNFMRVYGPQNAAVSLGITPTELGDAQTSITGTIGSGDGLHHLIVPWHAVLRGGSKKGGTAMKKIGYGMPMMVQVPMMPPVPKKGKKGKKGPKGAPVPLIPMMPPAPKGKKKGPKGAPAPFIPMVPVAPKGKKGKKGPKGAPVPIIPIVPIAIDAKMPPKGPKGAPAPIIPMMPPAPKGKKGPKGAPMPFVAMVPVDAMMPPMDPVPRRRGRR